ncbi:MAG: hypothetical protein JXR19_06625 [Bacteroidia bacterium]
MFEYDNRKKFGRSWNLDSFDGIGECNWSYGYNSKEAPWGNVNFHWSWWFSHYFDLIRSPRIIDCNLNDSGNHLIFKAYRDQE